ncbi:MAG TPA: peptide ABC transporter substrate-binding protein [Gemmatimonadales bacterium]
MIAPLLGAMTITSCARRAGCAGDYCGTVVFAAPGEPTTLLPPVTDEALDRDVFGQLFLKLADVGPQAATIGDSSFEPALAARWDWPTPLTLRFHLDPRARWHDGTPVTASDVVFTWQAYTDSAVDSPERPALQHIVAVTADDSATVTFRFDHRYPEMFFDAVYHMRVLPAHLLRTIPRSTWKGAAFGRAPIGDGPYRFARWTPGQSLELTADSTFFLGRPHIRRLIWRFTADLSVAVTQVIAGEADALQVLVTPANIVRAAATAHLALYPYPGSVYTTLSFNLRANGDSTRAHPVLGDAEVRRALVLATDRQRMAQSVFAGHAQVPPGPISQMWHALWFADLPVPAYDTAAADRLLDTDGWRRGADGTRERGGVRLSFRIAVPSSSGSRKQYAQLIQEELHLVGVAVSIDEMEAATMQDRERTGAYDAAIESWNTDPSPASGIPDAWITGGGGNFGHYSSLRFDAQVHAALTAETPAASLAAWHDALATLSADAPAVMLYALDNVAAIDKRISGVQLRPDEWWADVWRWQIAPGRLAERDRVVQ